MKQKAKLNLEFRPLTSERWKDFEYLFGTNGACGNCWCMFWKMKGKEFDEKRKTGETKTAIKNLVKKNTIPGLIAYIEGIPVGWMALEPRENYPRLANSRVLKLVDNKPVWSITCFFINKKFRRQGITIKLLNEAKKFVKQNGGKIVEGYPVKTDKGEPDPFVYTGLYPAFIKAKFKEAARRSERRPVMRYYIK